jgi:hypothetical protein
MSDPYRTAGDTPPEEAAKDEAEARRKARQRRMQELDEKEERRRADEREEIEEEQLAYREQEDKDEDRRRELERKHGRNRILSVKFRKAWVPEVGAATRFICLLPDYRGRKLKAMQKTLAHIGDDDAEKSEEVERLVRTCILYPHPERDRDMYQATINLTPLILGNLAKQMFERVAGDEEESRKK